MAMIWDCERLYSDFGIYFSQPHKNWKLSCKFAALKKCKMRNFFWPVFCLLFAGTIHAQDTVRTYWKNHKLMSVGVEKNGVQQGHWTYYHINGTKWTDGDFKDGRKIGNWTVWFDDGRISQQYQAENGPFKSWYPSGQVESEGKLVQGKRDGKWIF